MRYFDLIAAVLESSTNFILIFFLLNGPWTEFKVIQYLPSHLYFTAIHNILKWVHLRILLSAYIIVWMITHFNDDRAYLFRNLCFKQFISELKRSLHNEFYQFISNTSRVPISLLFRSDEKIWSFRSDEYIIHIECVHA